MNSRQFFKLVAFILGSSFLFYLVAIYDFELSKSALSALGAASPYIIALITAVTLYLLKYIDSISSSITPSRTEKNAKSLNKFQKSLKDLNHEAISNITLALVLFIILKVLEINDTANSKETILLVVFAFQFSMISLIFVIAIMQVNALRTAMSYRHVIENNK
jgi:hypothetical protein